MEKSLDNKLREIRTNPASRAFIIADAKDADMAFGVKALGPRQYLSREGPYPAQFSPEIWTREELSIRDRRLILFGAIGALGEKDTFAIQARAALKNEELTPDQLREIIITLANYAGYPRAAGLIGVAEQAIAAVAQEQDSGD